MSDSILSTEGPTLSNQRILLLMAILGLAGSLVGGVAVSAKFGLGVLLGTSLAFVNYFWLKISLKRIFETAAAAGEKPRLLGLKYFARYALLGTVVAIVYATNIVSMFGLILGLGAFGFAVVIEGILRIFSGQSAEGN